MAGKRKDRNGRVLKTGENQRKNGTYDYRYTDSHRKVRCIYAKTLEDLRKKEAAIQRDLADGIDYAAGEISVADLVDRYMSLKRDIGHNTKRAYGTVINRIKESEFGQMKVRNVKLSDAKRFYIDLHDTGSKRNTISIYHSVLRPTFEMAVDDDMIRKNPFKFKVADIIPDDAVKRTALTKQQQENYLRFIQENGQDNYYDDIIILMGTGLRVSELYGLTKKDVDFKKRLIFIDHQLCRTAEKPYFVKSPKTSSGVRCIPMSDVVYMALKRVVANRQPPTVELLVDGYSGFLFLDKAGMPKVAMHLENYMRGMQKKMERIYGKSFPRVTPHVLRHTFCTNMQRAGIDVKSLQYLMGHSNVSVTLDVYTHVDFHAVQEAFGKAVSNL
ncbi:site-specific integrase [Pseudoflavonifractor sp. AF19-9AC]|uniref:tyrosine-type recombinase/integrase n=1 Tax=Pseudoflavonifractor sp. AF19-9AC TaxID=2292244 RepID=UPI000E4D0C10|nr:tyrosine-type recombinase/integrase [Pseudoflavonifractor sp. AF19-9AC]RHR07512.1 site-specific integrase [Pseudoflavonifractor sp. AF19-9AC]